jgi:hypothetical protein
MHKNFSIVALALTAAAGHAAAQDLVYGVTDNQTLITWNSNAPGTVLSGMALTGFAANETVQGIDFRPATSKLYALGSFSNLYRINTNTGMASLVGAGSFAPALNGSSFGFDFNPVIDRIRVVSEVDQNLVLNPNTGTATSVTPLFFAAGDANEGVNPNVVGSAYTNSFAGATSTQLYGVDTNLDILITQANSAGTLNTVGSLGFDVNDSLTIDISENANTAYMAIQNFTIARSTFWTIDLTTGQATIIGEIGGGARITAMAVIPSPAAASLLLGAGAMGAARRRR